MGECQCRWYDINRRACVFVHTIIGHRHHYITILNQEDQKQYTMEYNDDYI